MVKVENPYAFPAPDDGRHADGYGMTLRDWFAGQALPAIISVTSAGQHQPGGFADKRPIHDRLAEDAYKLADAMLAERAKVQS